MQSKGGYSESGQREFQRDTMEIKRVPGKRPLNLKKERQKKINDIDTILG